MPTNITFTVQLTFWWSWPRLTGRWFAAAIGANSKLDGKSPGVLVAPGCSAHCGTWKPMEEWHRLPDITSGWLWSAAAKENCGSDGELSRKPAPAVTDCIGSKLDEAVLTAGSGPLLVMTSDWISCNKPRPALAELRDCDRVPSSDRMSANLDGKECAERRFLSWSALCRCVSEWSGHRYMDSGPLGRRSVKLPPAVEAQHAGADFGFIDNKHTN